MIPFGDDRRRQINLGGRSSTTTQAAVLAQVQEQRQRRLNERRALEAASLIQSHWRAYSQWMKEREKILREFDTVPLGSVLSTRLLVVGGCEHTRLVAWARAAIQAGEIGISAPCSGPEASSWIVLLRQIANAMITEVSKQTDASDAVVLLQCLNMLVSKRMLNQPTGPVLASQALEYLLSRDLYVKLSFCIQAIPIEAKSSPLLPGLVALSISPFRVFISTNRFYSISLNQLVVHLLTIQLLPNRLPISSLTLFSSQTPLGLLDQVPHADIIQKLDTNAQIINLLSNLLTFMPPRYSQLSKNAVESYLRLLNEILYKLPVGSLEPQKAEEATTIEWMNPDDSDDDIVYRPQSIERKPSDNPLDKKTALKLQTLVAASHQNSLISIAKKTPDSWKQYIKLIINISTIWPKKRDSLLTMIVVGSGATVIKQLWRENVRSSPLGRNEDVAALKNPSLEVHWPPLLLLTELYTYSLLTMADDEFFSTAQKPGNSAVARNPLSISEVILLSRQLLNIVFPLYWSSDLDGTKNGLVPGMSVTWEIARERLTKCLQAIHARDSRRPFTPPNHWLLIDEQEVHSFVNAAISEEKNLDEDQTSRKLSRRDLAYLSPRLGILNNIPFSIPFESRVTIFRSFIRNDRMNNPIDNYGFHPRKVTVRRGNVAQDGFDHLNSLGPQWKGRFSITFIDQFGQEEAGIDGGGVFKEFLTSLSKEVFDTDRGLWLATKQHELYPNPHSYAQEPHQLNWYRFIGRVLGKALYEGILVDVAFAGFFLAKWLGKQSYLDDLASLDFELYQGLIFLKNYTGALEELSLNFSIAEDDLGVTRSVDLKPNGSNISVTRENRLEYIALVSYYRLTRQIKRQSEAFFEGLSEIIDPKWLRMFNQQELKVLVGGAEEPVDIDDLRRNVVYGGLYDEEHPTIRMFWRIVKGLDQEKRKGLLRFVTSCGRPPLLGFKELNPKFAIRDAGQDQTRLPTASTCVNLLKLPLYGDEAILRQKLLQAISSNAGFDLS